MTREQIKRHDRKCLIILAIICMVLILHVTASTIRGNGERRKVAETKKAWIEQVHEGLTVKKQQRRGKTAAGHRNGAGCVRRDVERLGRR